MVDALYSEVQEEQPPQDTPETVRLGDFGGLMARVNGKG